MVNRAAFDVCPSSGRDDLHFNMCYATSITNINKAIQLVSIVYFEYLVGCLVGSLAS